MKLCTLSKWTCKTKASLIALYEKDIFKRQFCCDLMKKQQDPWAFVIIIQPPPPQCREQEKKEL